MHPSPRRCAFVATLAVLLAVPPAALHAQPISTAASAQINALLAEKESRTPAEQKVDSTLLHASRVVAGQPMAKGLAVATPQVTTFVQQSVAPDKTVAVTVRGHVTAQMLDAMTAAGATEVRSYPDLNRVTARLPISAVVTLAGNPDVQFIAPMAHAITHRMVLDTETGGVGPNEGVISPAPPSTSAGTRTSEGVNRHGADLAQSTGITGAGVKICVLSDSAYKSSVTKAQSTNDLPPNVQLLENPAAGVGENEGTAMMEIIYDMAPGATLAFGTAFVSDVDFAANIRKLRAAPYKCDIIADDVSYDNEGAFQDGIIAQAVNDVVASGALYFSSAANSGNVLNDTSGTWEGDFAAGGPAAAPLTGQGTVHSFGSTNYDVLTETGSEVTLQWSDPLGGSSNDYDLFALSADGSSVVASSTNVQNGSQDPFEYLYPSPPKNSRIVVVQRALAAPRALRIDTLGGTLAVGTVGSTYGHNAASGAYSVAAIYALQHLGQFNSTDHVEYYSSDGPRKMFYNADGSPITPGNLLFQTNGGTTLPKVDISAADCVSTTLPPPFSPFCGTSAAAPHAASIAGLLRSAVPGITPAQVRTALTTTAIDIEEPGFDVTSGYGIVMAPPALRAVMTPLTATRTYSPSSVAVTKPATLTITLANPNAVALQNVAFTESYPSGVTKTGGNPKIAGTGCTGTLRAASSSSLTLSGGVIPAGATCTYVVSVSSNTAATYVDSSGTATTPIGLDTALATAMLTVTGTSITTVAPKITSASTALFTSRVQGSFTVTTTGNPVPTLSILSGTLPSGITFTNNGDGTATIAGRAVINSGTFKLSISAANGVRPNATQAFTLTLKKS
jgi:hypothetical protein